MIKENFVPKYQKIIDDLRENVRSGVLAPGERLPVREELMQQYGVTRATVNRAMAELLREGLLVATPRAGTYVAERNTGDEVAVVVHSTLVMLHKMDWTIACNYYAMFGRLFQLLPENERKILNMEEVSRNPEILRHYRRILWNNLSQEDFENAVKAVGDRSRFLLLNRYYPDCDFVSVNPRQAAFDLAETFLCNLPENAAVGLLDMPYGRYLSNRFVWLERRAGFMDACEKHNRFCRVLELRQDDYEYNQLQLGEFDRRRPAGAPGVLLSPSNETTGFMLGFLRSHNYRFNEDYFYGDFDNEGSLNQHGIAIPSVLEDYAQLAELAYRNLDNRGCRLWCRHTIVNSPFTN